MQKNQLENQNPDYNIVKVHPQKWKNKAPTPICQLVHGLVSEQAAFKVGSQFSKQNITLKKKKKKKAPPVWIQTWGPPYGSAFATDEWLLVLKKVILNNNNNNRYSTEEAMRNKKKEVIALVI